MAGPKKPAPVQPNVDQQVTDAMNLVAREQPAATAGMPAPQQAGWFNQLLDVLTPSYMSTDPHSGDISYYPKHLEGKSTQEVADLLTHELTHRKQVKAGTVDVTGGGGALGSTPYYRRPAEIAAFEAQVRRAVGQGRSTVIPSFENGADLYMADTNLPMPKGGKRDALLQLLKPTK